MNAYKSEGALVAYLETNPTCASPERSSKEHEVLKNLVFNLNDLCNAQLPTIGDGSN